MMAARKKKQPMPEDALAKAVGSLAERYQRWQDIYTNGCADPFWTDGDNLWLVRNHIANYRREIREICEANNLPLPDIYFEPAPPEVPRGYMVTTGKYFDVRMERLRGTCGLVFSDAAPQMSLF